MECATSFRVMEVSPSLSAEEAPPQARVETVKATESANTETLLKRFLFLLKVFVIKTP
jgi:hypothetical protein